MPYHKNKQQAFQAAQQGVKQALDASEIDEHDAGYGSELNHLKQEVNDAYQQIENALETASEHQRSQLEQFRDDLESIVIDVNEEQ
ncbi:hypothetical protein CVD28_27005 [Bacillus sp. M6-12]|uniref:hypothetical protein n=1 Tax=Bacillus sp. M6-12 TaxID=2054166 RepID=UPI000C7759E9|nr:hypothetical protein [Bacillus sp. M6-12]PLS14700.1 hypothetical protein CVD28_27005 [Bacillus sp. M6-12]